MSKLTHINISENTLWKRLVFGSWLGLTQNEIKIENKITNLNDLLTI